MLEIAHEARLVDGADGTDPHGARRELPEIRHEPGVRIGAQSLAPYLPAKVGELLRAQAAIENRPRIDSGGRMRLVVHQVATVRGAPGAEEMVEAHLEYFRRGGEAGDVTAQLSVSLVGTHDHGERIPANDRGQPFLDGEISRVASLGFDRYGVPVSRIRRCR